MVESISHGLGAELRIVLIPRLKKAFSELWVSDSHSGAAIVPIFDPNLKLPSDLSHDNKTDDEEDVYNFPVIFHKSGELWIEANSFLLSLADSNGDKARPTDHVRRKASKLLNYLMFCEERGVNWADFSGRRPSLRPTYRYYKYLTETKSKSSAVINQYTGAVYELFKFLSSNFLNIDLSRVDRVRSTKVLVDTRQGKLAIEVEKRSQTRPVPKSAPVPIGYVRDEGEDLRPLSNSQLSELLTIIDGDAWLPIERLVMRIAFMTGARKQSVLTLRLRHIREMSEATVQTDGTCLLLAGPGTGIDTKYDKPQKLYFPKQLVDDLKIFISSRAASRRRAVFRERFGREHKALQQITDDDQYVFLSDQGNCYYMAKDDPRYRFVRSPPSGQVTETLRKKLSLYSSSAFPTAFTYHWLRATFAFQLYQALKPALVGGRLQYGEEISIIQYRLHHSDRAITENYLKLFRMEGDRLETQELYETWLFGSEYCDAGIQESVD